MFVLPRGLTLKLQFCTPYLIIITENFQKELAMVQIFQGKRQPANISNVALIFYAMTKAKNKNVMSHHRNVTFYRSVEIVYVCIFYNCNAFCRTILCLKYII